MFGVDVCDPSKCMTMSMNCSSVGITFARTKCCLVFCVLKRRIVGVVSYAVYCGTVVV